jgi:pimeloyl-ACP methyl ester carboxylesterase
MLEVLLDATTRSAFTRSLRAVVDWRGQVVTLLDRCYLTRGMPTLLVWGSRDAIVPVRHARRAYEAMPGSRLEMFDGVGHVPFDSDPARWSAEQWCQLLRDGADPTAPSVRAVGERSAP